MMLWRFPAFPESELARRRLVRLAQVVIIVALIAYLMISTIVLLSISDRNHQLLREQRLSSAFHAEQAHLSAERTNKALGEISDELARQLGLHDKQVEKLLKNIRVEVRALPDGTTDVIVRRVPGPTVTATPRCERLPNDRCRR